MDRKVQPYNARYRVLPPAHHDGPYASWIMLDKSKVSTAYWHVGNYLTHTQFSYCLLALKWLLFKRFHRKILYELFVSHISAGCAAHHNLDLIT
jgi:hypothetical protein